MKELPPDPPIYTPPPGRWFERHEHSTVAGLPETTPTALTNTLNAMWLTLLDRRREPAPAAHKFSLADREMLTKLIGKFGDSLMTAWRMACNHTGDCEDAEKAFRNLLSAKGLSDE